MLLYYIILGQNVLFVLLYLEITILIIITIMKINDVFS